jgi:oxaloacetate decarboxylase alpha subunit/pyruvate carboxylase subunit B
MCKLVHIFDEPTAQVRPRTLEAVRAEEDRIKKARAGLLGEKADKKAAPAVSGAMHKFHVLVDDEWFDVSVGAAGVPATKPGTPVIAPMPGMVVRVAKKAGDPVEKGETVVMLEAMKMQNAIPSPAGGAIAELRCKIGDSVAKGAVLCVIG